MLLFIVDTRNPHKRYDLIYYYLLQILRIRINIKQIYIYIIYFF
jgi:hypothetical protein